jgi:CAAX amino terminal protease family protein
LTSRKSLEVKMKEKVILICSKIRKRNEKILSKKPLKIIFWAVLPILAYFVASYTSAVVIRLYLAIAFWGNDSGYQNATSSVITTSVYSILFFGLMFAIIYLVPVKLFGQKISRKEIALNGLITWQDLALALVGFILAMILSGIFLDIASHILPNFNKAQSQNLLFQRGTMIHPWQFLMAFISIVVITPFVEEVIFRGMIYGQLRKINIPLAIFLTSLLFGIVHFQLNVGITVFVMSVIMCLIREKITKTIWSGIVIHMIKNGIAFAILYIYTATQFLNL